MRRTLRLIALLALAAAAASAHAERADGEKPVQIEADRMTLDDSKKVAVFEGRVVLRQGTRTLLADKLTVSQDDRGFQYGVAEGNPATYREKREGSNEWIDSQAQRIEYDSRNERVELHDSARLQRNQDEVRGNYIVYDIRSEFFRVVGASPSGAPTEDSRVRVVIQPKGKEGGDASKAGTPETPKAPAGAPAR